MINQYMTPYIHGRLMTLLCMGILIRITMQSRKYHDLTDCILLLLLLLLLWISLWVQVSIIIYYGSAFWIYLVTDLDQLQ